MHEATITNDPGFLRRAVYAQWRRQLSWWQWLMLVASSVLGVQFLQAGQNQGWGWPLLALLPLALVMWLGMGWTCRMALREHVRHMPPQVLLQSREDALVVRHGENVVAMEWPRLRKILRRPDHWLLFWTRWDTDYTVLSLKELPAAMQEHMLERARAAGTRIR